MGSTAVQAIVISLFILLFNVGKIGAVLLTSEGCFVPITVRWSLLLCFITIHQDNARANRETGAEY